MARHPYPVPDTGLLVTHLVVARDVAVTSGFYAHVLGGEIVHEGPGAPTFVKLGNTWIIVVEGGPGTPDKPNVSLAPPHDTNSFDAFLNIRVADVQATYREWTARGASFITPPLDNHGYEIRCYVRDPDGRIIEVGQHTGMLAEFGIGGG